MNALGFGEASGSVFVPEAVLFSAVESSISPSGFDCIEPLASRTHCSLAPALISAFLSKSSISIRLLILLSIPNLLHSG